MHPVAVTISEGVGCRHLLLGDSVCKVLCMSCNNHHLSSSTGCIPDIFLPNVPVGEIVNVSCNQAHPSFNPLGVMKWQCVSHLQWLGDYSACTFKEEAQNPLALLDYRTSSLDVTSALVMKGNLLSAVREKVVLVPVTQYTV